MSDYIDIIKNKIDNPIHRPKEPAHWIVKVVHDAEGNVSEIKRGGLMTLSNALTFARTMASDYPDALEIVMYELSIPEYKQYKAKGWS